MEAGKWKRLQEPGLTGVNFPDALCLIPVVAAEAVGQAGATCLALAAGSLLHLLDQEKRSDSHGEAKADADELKALWLSITAVTTH